ncbi:MAG: NAD(P)-dependent oxidoreductase [Bdellovibrionales bacterium]|nr:NAD(P)-dependent oxidoreductase [Bdellovibrionales bacterium]
MKIFVTGSTGFLGRALVRTLHARGHEVRRMQRRDPAPDVFLQDLSQIAANSGALARDLESFRPDAVLHLAWGWATNTHRNDPCHFTENLRATQALVDILADRLPGTRLIAVGSQAEYGVQNCLLTPSTACRPINAYGKAKLLAGEYALARLGERAAWLRLLTAYGPGDDPNKFLSYLVRSFRDGTVPQVSPGAQVWDWLFVDDAAEALALSAEQAVSGVHVLAAGEMASFRDITLKLLAIAQSKSLPAQTPNFGARGYNPNELFFLGGDSSSLQRVSGWRPRTRLDDGLKTLF